MAIGREGTCDYKFSVEENLTDPNTKWTGRGKTTRSRFDRPGLFGPSPVFELFEGLLTLRSSSPKPSSSRSRNLYKKGYTASATFEIGDALSSSIANGDVFNFRRWGSGDYGFSLFRNNNLILAMGGIAGDFLGSEVKLRGDSRLLERDFIDLLKSPPADLVTTVVIGNESRDLREGQEAELGPYYVYVAQSYKIGIPGRLTIMCVAQLSDKLTREMAMSCTTRFIEPDNLSTWWERYERPVTKWWQIW